MWKVGREHRCIGIVLPPSFKGSMKSQQDTLVQVLLQVLAIQAWRPELEALTWWKERTDSGQFYPDLSVCLTNCGTHMPAHTQTPYANKIRRMQLAWSDGPEISSPECSPEDPGFKSQHLLMLSSLHYSSSRGSYALSGLLGHCRHWCTDTHAGKQIHTHKINQ